MTYAPTVEYLRTTALAAGAKSFWHGKQATQSINYAAPFPQAHLFLMPAPIVGVNVQYRLVMCFYGADQHENAANIADPEVADQTLAIQDEMDRLSQAFIAQLREDDEFDLSEQIDRAPVLREGSQIGTGFLLTLTLTTRALC
jgi:hypothetical protein